MWGWSKRLRLYGRESATLRSWLREPDSLTARCERACASFRVRLLRLQRDSSWFPREQKKGQTIAREVLLQCDGRPVVYAHTELPSAPRGKLTPWLRRLGNRSLGSLLFSYPGFRRGALEYCRLDRQSLLFQHAITAAGIDDCAELWARRSWHCLGRQCVLVTEVFLPQILELEKREVFARSVQSYGNEKGSANGALINIRGARKGTS